MHIQKLDMPNRIGNVYVWFTVNNARTLTGQDDLPPDVLFMATLQSLGAVEALQLNPRDFSGNVAAVMRGWPATDNNITGSVLLVDDIQFTRSGNNIRFHANNLCW